MNRFTTPPSGGGKAWAQDPHESRSSVKLRLLAVAIVIGTVALALESTGVRDYLSFTALARNREWLAAWVSAHPVAAPTMFVLAYAICTALSLPTGLLLSTLGGFLFGTSLGGLWNVVGATLGATIVFLAARTVLGNILRSQAGPFLQKLEAGFRKDALSYMLVLRLVPIFPFWLVNLAPAFLGVGLRVFVTGTAVGIVPGALVYASLGTGLGAILESGGVPDGAALLKPHILLPLAGLAILALVPVALKRLRRLGAEDRMMSEARLQAAHAYPWWSRTKG